MPLYEYECAACGHRFERIRKFSDPPVETCPNCGEAKVQKLVSSPAIQFKGTGWYITDYAKKGSAGADTKSGAAKESKESGSRKSRGSRKSPGSRKSRKSREVQGVERVQRVETHRARGGHHEPGQSLGRVVICRCGRCCAARCSPPANKHETVRSNPPA